MLYVLHILGTISIPVSSSESGVFDFCFVLQTSGINLSTLLVVYSTSCIMYRDLHILLAYTPSESLEMIQHVV